MLTNNLYVWSKGRPPEKVDSIIQWCLSLEKNERHVCEDIFDDVRVSTTFLGIDHGFSMSEDATPILFETMVFGGDFDGLCHRYATECEARNGHWGVFFHVRDKIKRKES